MKTRYALRTIITFSVVMTMILTPVSAKSDDIKETEVFTSSENSRGMKGDYIPIADNINLFSSEPVTGYTQQWSNTHVIVPPHVSGYGVVTGHRCDSNNDLWYLDMKSNIRGFNSKNSISRFRWEVKNDNVSTVAITDWSPSGTQEATSGGYPINVSVGTFGISFKILQTHDKVIGEVGLLGSYLRYSVEFSTNKPVAYPDVQELNAVVHYDCSKAPNPVNWSWTWSWTVN